MARYPFTHTVRDPGLGIDLFHDVECEVEVSVEIDGGEPVISIDGVYIGNVNLFRGSTLAKMVATEIADAAEDDDALLARAIADDGIAYVGAGSNDPDGRFVRRAF